MSGYGTYTWTCGECGDSFSASGVVGDLRAERWGRDHKERHRVEKLPLEEQLELYKSNLATASKVAEIYGGETDGGT